MSLRDNPNIIDDVSDIRRDLDELSLAVDSAGSVTTTKLANGAVTTAKIANNAVTFGKIGWSGFGANLCDTTNTIDASTVTSTTPTTKMHINLPRAGKYLIMANFITGNSNGGFDGEVYTQIVAGSSSSDTLMTYMPNIDYASTSNVQTFIFTASSANQLVELKASVAWPARGTCYVNSGSWLMYLRIG